MNDLIKLLLPTIGNALLPGAGAAIGIATNWLAEKMGVPKDQVQQTLAGMKPEDLIKMKELDNELAIHLANNGIALDLAQISVNREEAKVAQGTDKWWVQLWIGGWRPYLGWIGGTGIGYQFLARPFLNGFYLWYHSTGAIVSGSIGPFPSLEIQDLFALVMTLLGHSALRTVDKVKGVGNGQ
jgi:hypothetical protein